MIPPGSGRDAVAAACVAWVGALAGRGLGAGAVGALAVLVAAAAVRRRPGIALLAAVATAAALSGWLSVEREIATQAGPLPLGAQRIAALVVADPVAAGGRHRLVATPSHLWVQDGWRRWRGPRLAVYVEDSPPVAAGERVVVSGRVSAAPGRVRGDPVAGTVAARSIEPIGPAGDPLFRTGNALRGRVQGELAGRGPAAALVSGFLIGDVAELPPSDQEALRRAGLTHFVAVSGSNVALFLGALWLAAGPLGSGPRRRAVLGLFGLAVFVVVTRWEPSVIRAAAMASLVLGGRLAGLEIRAWTALGGAVTLLLLVSGELAADVGFQLSVAATAGVLAAMERIPLREPRWASGALVATTGAQLAVAPLLLLHFGSVPLLAPLTNLVAAPLVAAATMAGSAGVVLGWEPPVAVALLCARGVLAVARAAQGWPQLGATGVAAVLAASVAWRTRLRPALVLAVAAWLAFGSLGPTPRPEGPAAVFLDVGQGDAALILGPAGEVVLVDGGPDPAVVLEGLRRRRVGRIDLMVVSHGHADHVTGLVAVADAVAVGRIWHPGHPEPTEALDELLAVAVRRGIPVEVPAAGHRVAVGGITIDVLAPLRRYAGLNDQSLVLRAGVDGPTVLFAGDVEAVAQRDLGPLPADILKVPHQGSATSDAGWLAASAGATAIISVGPNTFGHPAPWVIDVLESAGARVLRTDQEGDITLPLSRH